MSTPQALQNPLYILAITPFAELDTNFMISAKLVSLFFGALAMLVGYYFIQKFYSHLVAAIASAGFVMTHLYVEWSTLVACESLLVLLSNRRCACGDEGFYRAKILGLGPDSCLAWAISRKSRHCFCCRALRLPYF